MDKMFNVTSSPHVRGRMDTQKIMLCVLISLMPATLFGIYNFGYKALIIILVTVATCVLSEFLFNLIVKKDNTIKDLSAVVTGLLLALNLPHTLPWWQAVIGGVFAIVVVKMLFGGIGQNFMNPALGARCFLILSFTSSMTSFTYDGITEATPLAMLKNGESVEPLKMLLGTEAGTIGETSVVCLLIGAVFLLLVGIIDIKIPAAYIITFSLFIVLFGGHGFDATFLIEHLCGGGLMLGAFFMATDYATSPITPLGKIIFGILLGILTGIFRIFGSSAEGVSYAIIIGNLVVPLIEKATIPRAFGITKVKEVQKDE